MPGSLLTPAGEAGRRWSFVRGTLAPFMYFSVEGESTRSFVNGWTIRPRLLVELPRAGKAGGKVANRRDHDAVECLIQAMAHRSVGGINCARSRRLVAGT